MTREEAIQVLRDWDGYFMGHSSDDVNKALNLAIKALEQEPTTENNLEVQKAIEIIKADSLAPYSVNEILSARDLAVEALKQAPRKGHWIGHREHCENLGVMPSGLGAYEWCSNCDCGIDVREWHRNHYNFCPNCGADMREVEK